MSRSKNSLRAWLFMILIALVLSSLMSGFEADLIHKLITEVQSSFRQLFDFSSIVR